MKFIRDTMGTKVGFTTADLADIREAGKPLDGMRGVLAAILGASSTDALLVEAFKEAFLLHFGKDPDLRDIMAWEMRVPQVKADYKEQRNINKVTTVAALYCATSSQLEGLVYDSFGVTTGRSWATAMEAKREKDDGGGMTLGDVLEAAKASAMMGTTKTEVKEPKLPYTPVQYLADQTDFELRLEQIELHDLKPHKQWEVGFYKHDKGYYFLRVEADEADNDTGEEGRWVGRKWLLSEHMTDSEIVQTAFKAILTAAEHELREQFTYKDERVFDPHFDLAALVQARKDKKESKRADHG